MQCFGLSWASCRRLVSHLSLFLSNPGNKPSVFDLEDGETYILSGSNRFCYKNSVVPTWRQTWTRIQVSYMNNTYSRIKFILNALCHNSHSSSVWMSWVQFRTILQIWSRIFCDFLTGQSMELKCV